MKTILNNNVINIDEKSFLRIPAQWLFDPRLEISDFYRLCRLWWRYEFFANMALNDNPDADLSRVFYPSQEKLCELLGFKATSQSACSKYLKAMEDCGYITRIKSGYRNSEGQPRPRHYITVINQTYDFKEKNNNEKA